MLTVHPVNTMYARYLAEMLGIMGNYSQPEMTSSKITHRNRPGV